MEKPDRCVGPWKRTNECLGTLSILGRAGTCLKFEPEYEQLQAQLFSPILTLAGSPPTRLTQIKKKKITSLTKPSSLPFQNSS